jgi:hypothetical protein
VSYEYKVAGWVFIGLLHASILFYIMLFAMTQTEQRQNQWLESFILYLVIEILFVSTVIVLVTHVIVPSMAMKDVNNVKVRLQENMREFRRKLRVQQREKERAEIGNMERERSIGRSQFSIRRTPSPTTTVATATATATAMDHPKTSMLPSTCSHPPSLRCDILLCEKRG